MAAIAASAGVTTGALYKHFDGKADLFTALITAEMQRTAQMYGAVEPADEVGVARMLAGYLSLQHVRHPEQGCPLPTLTPEVARADEASKAAFQAALLDIHATLQRLTPTAEDAWTLMAQNVGAVMLARAIPDESLQREILGALRRSGERLLAGPAGHSSGLQGPGDRHVLRDR
jgi:AcrR family transcriptional regulator